MTATIRRTLARLTLAICAIAAFGFATGAIEAIR